MHYLSLTDATLPGKQLRDDHNHEVGIERTELDTRTVRFCIELYLSSSFQNMDIATNRIVIAVPLGLS